MLKNSLGASQHFEFPQLRGNSISLFNSVPYFLMGFFVSLESNFLSSLYIMDISPLSGVGFQV